jgi:hypothetical protein
MAAKPAWRRRAHVLPEVSLPAGYVPPLRPACADCRMDDLPLEPGWRLCRVCLELRELRQQADPVERFTDPGLIFVPPSLIGLALLVTAVPVVTGIGLHFPLLARVLTDVLGPPFIAACGCLGWRLGRRHG